VNAEPIAVSESSQARVIYAREPMEAVVGEIWPLLQAHWREIAH
jgi:hypothetical protein